MKLIITEKQSFANELSKVLNIKQRGNGFFFSQQNTKYKIVSAQGHLLELPEPSYYDPKYKQWSLDHLPIIPKKFKDVIKKDTKKKFDTIAELIGQADSLICATDAGREGELIFRLIYKLIGQGKPVERLWVSSNEHPAIRAAMDNLFPMAKKNGLYAAARSRQVSDWLVGFNSTRALTCITGGQTTLSLGRVQTPILKLIVERYLEHINFKSVPYWQPELTLNYNEENFKATYADRIWDQQIANQITNSLSVLKETKLVSVDKKNRTEQPPLLFNLTSLQSKANNLFAYSAKKTLDTAQSLYENKLITYPRTNSKHLTKDMFQSIPARLSNTISQLEKYVQQMNLNNLEMSKRIFDNSKVTDHHALLPTKEYCNLNNLNEAEQNIYKLIASSLVMAFMQPCLKLDTKYIFEPNGHKFISKGTVVLNNGWRSANLFAEESEKETLLPEVPENSIVNIVAIADREKKTKAPPVYTVGSLFPILEGAEKLIDKDTNEVLNKFEIGTVATRDSIMEKLHHRNYIFTKVKKLIPTETGIMVYRFTKDLYISDITMTGHWEYKMKQIELGKEQVGQFKNEIENYTKQIVKEISTINVERTDLLQCPKCKKNTLLDKAKLLSCTKNNCDFVLWKKVASKALSQNQIKQLLTKGLTTKIKGFKNKQKEKFDAALKFDQDFKVSFVYKK